MPDVEHPSSVLEIHLEGTFDARAAGRVAELLDGARAGNRIRIDLTRSTDIQDFGLAALAQVLKPLTLIHAKILLTGLSLHHLRLLRHLGLDPALVSYPLRHG
jgi:anti-anti-sigma regulatory factor